MQYCASSHSRLNISRGQWITSKLVARALSPIHSGDGGSLYQGHVSCTKLTQFEIVLHYQENAIP